MNFSIVKGIGEYIDASFAAYAEAVAAGTGDATEVNGGWVDRRGRDSVAVFIAYRGVLTAAATLSIAANLQDAVDGAGTGAADFGAALANAVRATGAGGGSTETGTLKISFDLTAARRYIRLQMTPDLSAGATDTARVSAMFVWGPAADLPATAALNA